MTGIVSGLHREVVELSAPEAGVSGSIALAGETPCSYGELWSRVEAVAGALADAGAGPGERVAIWLPKGADYVAAILATLRLGGCYVPLDAAQPAARAHVVLNDADPAVLVTSSDLVAGFAADELPRIVDPAGLQARNVPASPGNPTPEDDAALLYTSGSTGKPKGVRLTHRNVAAFVRWCLEDFPTSDEDLVVNHAPFTFDISLHGLFVPLAVGASLLVLSDEDRTNPKAMAAAIERERPTMWYSVPFALDLIVREVPDALGPDTSLRTVLYAGEEYPSARLAELSRRLPAETVIGNLYGPTETNVCIAHVVDRDELDGTTPVPLGSPVAGAEISLIDDDGARITEAGDLGEIVVTGSCVSPGYRGRDPRPAIDDRGTRQYHTGDLGFYDERGRLCFQGRADRQVKLGGYRVELGEVEAALAQLPGVHEVAVERVVTQERAQLVAFLTADEPAPGLIDVKQHCARLVPRYMIPHRVRKLDSMPRNANGKVDHGRLAELYAETEGE
ncbi:amino acid adenylation domain-containing protein [Prauserella isguenensis]|uniref:Amino acid adenylation domain-containing protein n=1 Tax=Prauserella isguenensis TaxID=1470180 RepID=A0A839S0Z6_9PSEU|nr:amino acid adenylation domain-containing protein [Prauserella isguenensis]MBB3050417.1 amino acid adenylation domain-containing protein [Prauserella isguenensis]